MKVKFRIDRKLECKRHDESAWSAFWRMLFSSKFSETDENFKIRCYDLISKIQSKIYFKIITRNFINEQETIKNYTTNVLASMEYICDIKENSFDDLKVLLSEFNVVSLTIIQN